MVGTLDFAVIDEVRTVTDRESFLAARRLARDEGIFAGGSSGTAVHTAAEVARELGPGKTVVVIICDSGDRYLSKYFDDDWMKDLGFLGPDERHGTVRDLLRAHHARIEFADADESLEHVARRMADLGISQMPVEVDGSLRMIHESDILRGLVGGACVTGDPVSGVATALEGQVSLDDPLGRVQKVFDENNVAVAVDHGQVVGIVSKIDVVTYLAERG